MSINLYKCTTSYHTVFGLYYDRRIASNHIVPWSSASMPSMLGTTTRVRSWKKRQKSSEEHQSRTGTQMFGISDRILLLLLLLLLFGVAAVVSMVLGDVSQLGNLVGCARLKAYWKHIMKPINTTALSNIFLWYHNSPHIKGIGSVCGDEACPA